MLRRAPGRAQRQPRRTERPTGDRSGQTSARNPHRARWGAEAATTGREGDRLRDHDGNHKGRRHNMTGNHASGPAAALSYFLD